MSIHLVNPLNLYTNKQLLNELASRGYFDEFENKIIEHLESKGYFVYKKESIEKGVL